MGCSSHYFRLAFGVTWLVVGSIGCAMADAPTSGQCDAASLPQSVVAGKATLEHSPDDLKTRIAVTDGLIEKSCYVEAIAILQAGVSLFPRNSELKSRLRDAQSMLSEQHYFEGLDRAQAAAKAQRNLLRCRQLADIAACDAALQTNPDDVGLLLAKGDALLAAERPAQATLIYRRADQVSPSNDAIRSKLAGAETKRQVLVARCQAATGQAGVEACDAAWLRAAVDEFQTDTRKAMLLQSLNMPEAALDSYLAAQELRQNDKQVAVAIVALTDGKGRRDAVALAARGKALLAIGHATESLRTLREAQSLAPALPNIKGELQVAERMARQEIREETRKAAIPVVASKPAADGDRSR